MVAIFEVGPRSEVHFTLLKIIEELESEGVL